MKNILFALILFLTVFVTMDSVRAEYSDTELGAEDKAYFISIQAAILQGHKQWVVDQIYFPMLCALHGHKTMVKTKKEFLRHYDEIINAYVLESLRKQKPDKLFKNWQGMMVGDGAIWFAMTKHKDRDPWVYRIYTINNIHPMPQD